MEAGSERRPVGEGTDHPVVEMPVVAATSGAAPLSSGAVPAHGPFAGVDLKGHQRGGAEHHGHHHYQGDEDDGHPDDEHAHHVRSDEHPLTVAHLPSEHAAAHGAAALQPAQPKQGDRQLFENLTADERQSWFCCSILGSLAFFVGMIVLTIYAAIPLREAPNDHGSGDERTAGDSIAKIGFIIGAVVSGVLMLVSCFACTQLWPQSKPAI